MTAATAASAAASASIGSSSTYRSAFEGYRGYQEQPVTSWRDANDLVGRIGGWQAYARESQGAGGGESPEEGAGMAGHAGMAMPGGNHDQRSTSGSGTLAPMSPAASSPGTSPAAVKAPAASNAGARPAADAHSSHKAP